MPTSTGPSPRASPSSNGLRQRKNSKSTSTSTSKSSVHLPRLVNRDLPFHQSRNRITVENEKHHSHIYPLLIRDWFHVLLRLPVLASISFLLVTWTSVILIFAKIYTKIDTYYVDDDCGLGPPGEPLSWGTAFAFSLETCTTVGCKYSIHFLNIGIYFQFLMFVFFFLFSFFVLLLYLRWFAGFYQRLF
jgi:hypothetical protein